MNETWSDTVLGQLITYGIVGFAALLALFLVFLVVLGPSVYDAYKQEFIELNNTISANEPYQTGASSARSNSNFNAHTKLKVKTSVQIIVLGDIGRSPRMQYHAISLAKHGARVDLIGFHESEIHPELQHNRLVKIIPLNPPPAVFRTNNKLFFLLFAPIKVVWQTFDLLWTLSYRTRPARWMLVQNPPSIPVLAIAAAICHLRNTSLVIDWHNFGWSVLALRLGNTHPLVSISRFYENWFAYYAEFNFAVTRAMSAYLAKKVHIKALPLHDRPAAIFKPTDSRLDVLKHLDPTKAYAVEISSGSWRLLVSSTSWTADEDFSLLLDGLVQYSQQAVRNELLPHLLVVITGKGPQQQYYLTKIKELNQAKKLFNVVVITAWLSFDDYAQLLSVADLGISLHKSTSGLDLPMKVVDMLGSGLPVAGYSGYESWSELIQEGVNGRGFEIANEVGDLLVELLSNDAAGLKLLKEGALKEGSIRWDDVWDDVAGRQVFGLGPLAPENSTPWST